MCGTFCSSHREESMHPFINLLVELHNHLEEANKLVEKIATDYAYMVKKTEELEKKIFWLENNDA